MATTAKPNRRETVMVMSLMHEKQEEEEGEMNMWKGKGAGLICIKRIRGDDQVCEE